MRIAAFVTFLLATFLATDVYANVPHDLWGYFPGQTLDQAQRVDASRNLQDCDFRGVWKCILWDQEYFGSEAKVAVQFDENRLVTQIVVQILKLKPEPSYDCRKIVVTVLSGATSAYGSYARQNNNGREFVWDDGTFAYKLTVLCIVMPSGEMAGGIVASLGHAN